MAAGEVWLEAASPDYIYFKDRNDVTRSRYRSGVSSFSAGPDGELFIDDPGSPPYYLAWSLGGNVYRLQLVFSQSTSEPEGSIWIAEYLLKDEIHVSLNGNEYAAP